jgi:predicted dehydrogenase
MEPLRIGVLGAARISELAIVKPAGELGHRLVAVAARDRNRAEEFARRNSIERVHGSYLDVITDSDVEAIYNPLANSLHGPWNIAAIQAGKHILTEKPFASNADEARKVRDAASSAGVAILEGFHYLYHPVTQRLHDLLDAGELGDLRAVEVDMFMPAPDDDDPRWSYQLAGGALMDIGCYSLHAHGVLARWAGGRPQLLTARGGERAGHPGVDEWLDAELQFPGGATGRARCHMAAEYRSYTYRIIGSRGEATAENFVQPHVDDRVTVTTAGGTRVERLGRRSSYAYQLEAFAAHVRYGAPLRNDADDAVATMQLIDACYQAAGFTPRPRSQPVPGSERDGALPWSGPDLHDPFPGRTRGLPPSASAGKAAGSA